MRNDIKKILIDVFTMPKHFYIYKSMGFVFLWDGGRGAIVKTLKLFSGT